MIDLPSRLLDEAADALDADDRASIIAFLTAELKRFKEAADMDAGKGNNDISSRLYGKASLLRTLILQIQRGDDKVTT
jgi:hypothetical protein